MRHWWRGRALLLQLLNYVEPRSRWSSIFGSNRYHHRPSPIQPPNLPFQLFSFPFFFFFPSMSGARQSRVTFFFLFCLMGFMGFFLLDLQPSSLWSVSNYWGPARARLQVMRSVLKPLIIKSLRFYHCSASPGVIDTLILHEVLDIWRG